MNYRQLQKSLESLGESRNTVSDTLLRGHWVGYPDDPQECPVAQYLNETWPGYEFAVDPGTVMWHEDGVPEWDTSQPLPLPVTAFIKAYDAGAYPELELHDDLDIAV